MGAGFAAALAVMAFLPYMIADFPRFDVVESQLSPPTASSFRKMLLNMQHDQVLARDPSARPWRPLAPLVDPSRLAISWQSTRPPESCANMHFSSLLQATGSSEAVESGAGVFPL